jgi:2-keto-4-pentenoate hydratase
VTRLLTSEELRRAAALIANAYRDESVVEALPPDCIPNTVSDGKAIQDIVAGLLGWETIGWKAGHSSPAKQAEYGDAAPVLGRLFSGMVMTSPAVIPDRGLRRPLVEGELVVSFGGDLLPRAAGYTMMDVRAAVDSIMPGIEFADVRSSSVTSAVVNQLIAFNAGAYRLIVGQPLPEIDLASLSARIVLDGCVVSDSVFLDQTRPDPIAVAHQVINEFSERGIAVHAGQLLSTGAILPYPRLGTARHAAFEVSGYSMVELTIGEPSRAG